jgi:hypothetical protein
MQTKCVKCGHPLESVYDICECNFAEFDKAMAKFIKHSEKLGKYADDLTELADNLSGDEAYNDFINEEANILNCK